MNGQLLFLAQSPYHFFVIRLFFFHVCIESLQDKLEATTHIYSTLLTDNNELKAQLERLTEGGASEEDGPSKGEMERLNQQILSLQKVMDEQVGMVLVVGHFVHWFKQVALLACWCIYPLPNSHEPTC